MATTAAVPLLQLTTLVDRPSVEIDGVKYALLMPDTLSLLDYQRLSLRVPRLEELWTQAVGETPLTEAQETELREAFQEVCGIILRAPEAVQAKLTDLQRVQIYQSFLALPSATLRRMGAIQQARTALTPAGSIGATSSPASSVSTRAAALKTGSRGRRSRSSEPA